MLLIDIDNFKLVNDLHGHIVGDRPPASLAALIEQGDAALYESKRGGRDSIRLVAGGEA